MVVRRAGRCAAVVCAAAGLVLLAGCDKSLPRATLTSDGEKVRSEAAVYCFKDGRADADVLAKDCEKSKNGIKEVDVRAGTRVRIDVEQRVAKAGWRVALLSSAGDVTGARAKPGDTSYTFTAPPYGQADTVYVEVVQLIPGGPAAAGRGIWKFLMRNPDR